MVSSHAETPLLCCSGKIHELFGGFLKWVPPNHEKLDLLKPMVLGIPQFKKPLFVVRSLATSTGENDPENLHLDQRLGQAPSPMARHVWMPRSLRRQSRPSWGFRKEFSRALHLKPLVYIWWKVSDDMLIQERVLAAKPEAMILAVAQLFCLPASDTGYLQNCHKKG